MTATGGGSTGPAGDPAGTAVMRAVLHVLLCAWRLSLPEAARVLGVPPRTLLAWRDDPGAAAVGPLLGRRLSGLIRLHKSLRARCPGLDEQRAWLRRRGADGRTPLERLSGDAVEAAPALCRELEAGEPAGSGSRG